MEIDVIQITKEEQAEFGGASWADLKKIRETLRINYGYNEKESAREGWRPPTRFDNATPPNETKLPYLPLNHSWLREVNGRAFLYSQNW